MNNKIDWVNDRINITKMGRKWTIVNWCFIFFGVLLATLNFVGNSVFNIPEIYIMYAGFVYMFALIVYILTVLVLFAINKNIADMSAGMPVLEEDQMNPYGNAVIDDSKHETTFIKPEERWQYGVLYLGLAIWLSKNAIDLFKTLFLENHHPMSIGEYVMPVLALVLCTVVPIAIFVIGLKQFVKPDPNKID